MLRDNEVFAAFSPDELARLAPHLAIVELGRGACLFSQADAADALYVVASGALEAFVGGANARVMVGAVRAGDLVGEMQILFGGVRSATVVATKPSRLVEIPRAALASLDSRVLGAGLSGLILRRLRRNQLLEALRMLFGALDGDAIAQLEDACEWMSVRRGDVVCTAGEVSDCLYVVVNGWLRAFAVDAGGLEVALSDLGKGECVGEMALITGEPRMATVRAIRDCDLVRIEKPAVDAFLRRHPDALMHMTRLVVRRYQSAVRARPSRRAACTIALVPLARDRALFADLVSVLSGALATHGSVIHVTSSSVDQRLGVSGIAQSRPGTAEALRVSAWLRQVEDEHRFVILEADSDASTHASPWTERIMRDSDERLLVADSTESPDLRPVERADAADDSSERVRLVLVHPATCTQPRDSAAWLGPRSVQAHHHCRRGAASDVQRLARVLAGAQIGVVFGGGGVRGLAHVGVMRALAEAGIPVDMIGGTSIGAIIGAQWALGRSSADILDETRRAFGTLVDYTLPAVALAAGETLGRALRDAFGETQFEDTWLPYFCVASNLTRAEVTTLDRGTLWRAVRASCGLPGVFPPVGIDGDLLVDGCLLNNLPVDVMARRCAGPIISVDATPKVDLEAHEWTGDSVSGFRYLLSRVNPLLAVPDVPGIARILQRAAELSSVSAHRARLRDAGAHDLLLTPAVSGIPTLDVRYADRAVEAGYRAAVEALRTWPMSP